MLNLHHVAPITPWPALDPGQAALLQETSPLASDKKKRSADRKSSRLSTLSAELHWELCEDIVIDFIRHTWHFNPQLTPFKTPAVTITAKCEKLTHFKTLVFYIGNWLLSRPCTATHMAKCHKLTPFKTLTFYVRIDSFQDPQHFRTHISGTDTPGSELHQTQCNWLISRPLNWIIQCFNLHGRLPAKSPWETTFKKFHQNPLQSEFWTFSEKIRRRTHWMHLVSSSQAASLARPAFSTAVFAKMHSFQDPKNFTYIIDSNNRLQTLSHRLRDRTRTS